MITLFQEGDELLYRIAFACQKRRHYLVRYDKVFTIEDLDLRQIKKKCEENKLIEHQDYIIHSVEILKPLKTANLIFLQYLRALYKLIDPETNKKVSKVNIYFGNSKTNFRNAIAKTPGPNGLGYKAGRAEKPIYYQYVKNIMLRHKDVSIIEGYEADDALGIASNLKNVILSHIDKDLNMLPGCHYNWVDCQFYHIDNSEFGSVEIINDKIQGRGLKWFYAQLLLGDRTDNIPGVPKYGPVKVTNILQDIDNEKEAISLIKKIYVENFGENGIIRLKEIADLIWIVRDKNETGSQYLQKRGLL